MPVMRHQDDTALKSLQRLVERQAHFQIKVVSRFVQQQQIWTLPDQQGENQSRFLPSGKGSDRLQHFFTPEIKPSQVGANVTFAELFVEALHDQYGIRFEIELLNLVLGEIPDLQLLRARHFTAEGRQLVGE